MLKFFDDYYCIKFERSSVFCKTFRIANSIGLIVFLTAVCFDSITIVLSGILIWTALLLVVLAVTFLKDFTRALALIARDELRKRYRFTFNHKNNVVYFSTISRAYCGQHVKKKSIVLYCETEYTTPHSLRCVVHKNKQIASV